MWSNDKQVSLETLSRVDVINACEAAKKEWGEHVAKFNEFKDWLLNQLGLKDKERVKLTTRLAYDYIVDTSINTSQECAREIFEDLHAHRKPMDKSYSR